MQKIVTGFVTDNQDPEKQGRVKVNLYLSFTPTETDWLPVMNSYTGDSKEYPSPDVGDIVVIAFMDEGCRKGFIMGVLGMPNMEPPIRENSFEEGLKDDTKSTLKEIYSKSGLRIIIDETEEAETVQIINQDGSSRIELNGEEKSILVETERDLTLSPKDAGGIFIENLQFELGENASIQTGKAATEVLEGTIQIGGKKS